MAILPRRGSPLTTALYVLVENDAFCCYCLQVQEGQQGSGLLQAVKANNMCGGSELVIDRQVAPVFLASFAAVAAAAYETKEEVLRCCVSCLCSLITREGSEISGCRRALHLVHESCRISDTAAAAACLLLALQLYALFAVRCGVVRLDSKRVLGGRELPRCSSQCCSMS